MTDEGTLDFSDNENGCEFKTSGEKAYEIIYRKIIKGEFAPGFRLSKRKMADLTGVSVIPVAEALKRLEDEGLVESKPQWGAFVTIPTRKKIIELYMVREAVECQVARIMAEVMTDEQEQELREIGKKLDSVPYSQGVQDDLSKLHYLFHSKMTHFTGFALLETMLRKTSLFYLLFKAISHTRVNELAESRYWHELLVDQIKSGNPDQAERAMRAHIRESFQAILRDIK